MRLVVRRSEEEKRRVDRGAKAERARREGKKREREKRDIERKGRSMYLQWPQQPRDVAPVHLHLHLHRPL